MLALRARMAGIGEREGVSRVRGTLHYCTEGVEVAGEEGGPGSGTKPTGASIQCPVMEGHSDWGNVSQGSPPSGKSLLWF